MERAEAEAILDGEREGLAAQKQFGQAGLAIAERLFAAWDEYRLDGDRARRRLRSATFQEK